MKVILQDHALADLEGIYSWIARDSPANAGAVVARILDSIEETLAHFPFVGRAGAGPDTREWTMPGLPYIVVYEVDQGRDVLFVRAIYHGAQRR